MPRELKLDWREIPLARRGKDMTPGNCARGEGEQISKLSLRGPGGGPGCEGQTHFH